MTTRQLSFKGPPQLAITAGATTPDPGITGVQVWSTTENAIVTWNGSSWEPPATGGGGGGSATISTAEINLGQIPKRSGRFTISGSGMTTGKPVILSKALGPYTGKGTRADEAEMDMLSLTAKVTSSTQITAYWHSSSPVRGNIKFNYLIGA